MKVTAQQCAENNICSKGMRKFAERYGLDYEKFVKEGIEAIELLKTKDHMAIQMVEKVKNGR